METNDKMPQVNKDYPENDISNNQRIKQYPEKKDQNKTDENVKGTGADIANLPEIKPARTGILG